MELFKRIREKLEYENEKVSTPLGIFENGILEVFEGIITIKKETLESVKGYRNLRKIIFPASLEEVDECLFEDCEQLEEVDFSKVTLLKKIPEDFISCGNLIKSFIIPYGVEDVDRKFLGYPNCKIIEVYVPDSVNKIGEITAFEVDYAMLPPGMTVSPTYKLVVFLYAANLNISSDYGLLSGDDCDILYVLPQHYSYYSAQLKEYKNSHPRRSVPRLLTIPAYKINFYNNKPSQINENVSVSQKSVASENEGEKDKEKVDTVFSERIDNLITAALQDGYLTDKEKEILKRRVEKEGEEWDEVEMYIESLILKKRGQ